jgi:hypothetical protein
LGILQHLVQPRPFLAPLGSADASVAIFLDDLPSTPLRNPVQFAQLIFNGLPVRRYTDVNCGSFCHPQPPGMRMHHNSGSYLFIAWTRLKEWTIEKIQVSALGF